MSFSQYESSTTRRPLPAGGAPNKFPPWGKKERKEKEKRLNLLNNYCMKSVCTVQYTLSLYTTVHKFGRMYI